MASRSAARAKPQKKIDYFERFNRLIDTHKTILVVCADNVLSGQMHSVRICLRGRAEIVMGKNTLMRKIIRTRYEQDDSESNKILFDAFIGEDILRGNVGCIFTNEPVRDICEVLGRFKVSSAARAGSVAPLDVVIPAGQTGLEPTQTAFFMALDIPTKIEKGQVSILKDVVVCRTGHKVGSSEAKLLQKMKLKPFMYGLEPEYFLEEGIVFPASFLKVDDAALLSGVQIAVDDIAAMSLAAGILTPPALSHSIFGAFKECLALAIAADSSFEEFGAATFIQNIKEGKVSAAAPAAGAAAPAAAAAAAPAAAAVEEEEEATDFGMDLF
eukprot:TRINITY_DN205_c0_g1_i1.p2 TRINITY_DN205_c0_g1~~TRINITY_DN205_c0_g1_i1.p2  ORF type:complete len:347 (+),score=112.26 TRINITY_DN205_c0_g1_i1:60-1043(+)